ncbi:MAG: penicillin-binding transpeptidase domain-containing protein, partial [Rhodocyclaceae bacterium]|nr:penicillin-binding transpeptidase domain-containing protein [Rhodocyclaceae bacterium]
PPRAGVDAEQAIDPRNAFIMTTMMREVIRSGTATRALALGRNDLAGKTGTTNDAHDAWFAGYNHALVAVVWVGYDQPRSLGERETGGGVALPIWINFMRVALRGVPEVPLKPPPGVVNSAGIEDATSVDAGHGDWFYAEFPPRRFVDPLSGNDPPRSRQDDEVRQQLF